VGFSELGVFRPSTHEWFVAGHGAAVSTFGSSGDIPVSSAYAYRALPGSTGSVSASVAIDGSDDVVRRRAPLPSRRLRRSRRSAPELPARAGW